MGKKIKRSRVRSKGKESAKAFVESVDQKMNVLDKWLFGEDVKERSEKAKLQQRQQGPRRVNQSRSRSTISVACATSSTRKRDGQSTS